MASGDRDVDRKAEDKILRDLKRGNGWAWASVHVVVIYRGILRGDLHLGCCSYDDEDDFKADVYYTDMVKACIGQINAQLRLLAVD